jgi:subfamily B ATP-binding cassette protein MsbA
MAVVAAADAAYPLLIRWTVSRFEARDLSIAWAAPAAVLVLVLVKGAAAYTQTYLTERTAERVVNAMRRAMFRAVTAHDLSMSAADKAGALASRFSNDVRVLKDALARAATNLVRDVLTVIAFVATMIWLDWVLALVVLVVYPLAAIPIVNIGKRLRRVAADTQGQLGELTALLGESFGAAKHVKAFGLEDREARRADSVFERVYQVAMRAARARAGIDPLMEALGGVAIAGIVAIGGWRIAEGQGSIADFAAFLTAALMAARPLRALGTLNGAVQEGLAAADRIFSILDSPPHIVSPPNPVVLTSARGEVALRDVTFAYPGHDPALKGVSLHAAPGEVVALVGPSGAGKSTILNLLPRFYDVQGGSVLVDGHDVRDLELTALRRSMSLVTQEAVLFNETIAENIAHGCADASREAIREAARMAAADRFIGETTDGYESVVGERGERLSGGQRQRIAIARAVLKDAPILLLDEATSALDAESERLVQSAIERISQGRTTLVIAHRLATVRRADRIYVLDQGEIVEEGTHTSLMAANGLYASLAQLQFAGDAQAA